ncbi:hypothetical protein BDN71DRAFT_1433381 [Pleurotus eryngii]|uniref:Uncharacterized protein n=1 Tax=Pleurotus eryngii TaxID=5323 RepID=A0A9P5ZT23_PLEER|nr:hypothetical protein BDN71DRAFT_1433381 [Pleurotus eryngii]
MLPKKKPSAAVLAKLQQLQATPDGQIQTQETGSARPQVVDTVPGATSAEPAEGHIGTCASNKTTRPAKIILDNKQKRHSSAEVKAEKIAKNANILTKKLADNKAHQLSLRAIAAEEDQLRMQDMDCWGESFVNNGQQDEDFEMVDPVQHHGDTTAGAVVNVSDDDTDGLSLPLDEPDDFYYDNVDCEDDGDFMPVVDVKDTEASLAAPGVSDKEHTNMAMWRKSASTTSKGKKASGNKQKGHEKGLSMDKDSKHAKTAGIGGIRADWKPTQKRSQSQAVSSGPIVNKAVDDQDNDLPGEFDDNEDHNIGKVQNQTTLGSTATKVDVTKTKAGSGIRDTSQAESHTYALHDLPFPEGEGLYYSMLWREMRASLINWSGTLPDMFSAVGHPDFANVVCTLWLEKFTVLHDKVDHPAIIAMAGATLTDHRSAIGKAALAAVTNKVPVCTPPHEATDIIAGYAVPCFIYFDPNADTKKGTFLSLIIQETLATHMATVLDADKAFGHPVGALALCCAAVCGFRLHLHITHFLHIECALNSWKDGANSIKESKKDTQLNRQTAFKADQWGPVAVCWMKAIQGAMTDTQWNYLICESCAHIHDNRTTLNDATNLKPFAECDVCETIAVSNNEYLDE